jgi:hypothetical protein
MPASVGFQTSDESAFGTQGFRLDAVAAGDAGGASLWMSLAQAQSLVAPTQDPQAYYGVRVPYVVAVLGDPGAPAAFGDGGTYDGRGLHVLVLPSANVGQAP